MHLNNKEILFTHKNHKINKPCNSEHKIGLNHQYFFFQNKMHCLKRVITFCGEKVKTQGVGEKVES